jgi:hypothetical protein
MGTFSPLKKLFCSWLYISKYTYHICIYVYIPYICVYKCICIYVCIHMHICICIYSNTQIYIIESLSGYLSEKTSHFLQSAIYLSPMPLRKVNKNNILSAFPGSQIDVFHLVIYKQIPKASDSAKSGCPIKGGLQGRIF